VFDGDMKEEINFSEAMETTAKSSETLAVVSF
jgi:hypothetical protein